MKRLLTLLLLTFQFTLLSSHDWKLSVEPIFGMKYGEIGEYVFLKKCDYADDKLSELNWDIKSELYASGKISGGWKNIFGEMLFTAGIPMKIGEMRDSDWLNADKKNAEDYQYKTNYSESDNYLKYDFLFGIKAGYEFDIFENEIVKINLKPNLGFDYKKFCLNGKNGYAWYGSSTNTYYLPYETATKPTHDFSGKNVIDYTRQTYITWLGFNSTFTFLESFAVNLGFQISPYIYAESIDIHYMNNDDGKGTAYLDATTGYFSAFKWNLGSEYKINSRHSILLSANWLHTKILRGDSYSKSYPEYKKIPKFSPRNKNASADGGASEHYFDLSISYRFRIF